MCTHRPCISALQPKTPLKGTVGLSLLTRVSHLRPRWAKDRPRCWRRRECLSCRPPSLLSGSRPPRADFAVVSTKTDLGARAICSEGPLNGVIHAACDRWMLGFPAPSENGEHSGLSWCKCQQVRPPTPPCFFPGVVFPPPPHHLFGLAPSVR